MQSRPTTRRRIARTTLGAAAIFALQPATPASAEVRETKGNVYVDTPYCTEGKAHLEREEYGQQLRVREARTDNVSGTDVFGSNFCLGAISRPAGFIRASGLLARGSDWCVADAPKYSTSTTDSVIRGVGFHGNDLPCGDGNYRYTSLSEVLNGQWNGGHLTTGSLYMWK